MSLGDVQGNTVYKFGNMDKMNVQDYSEYWKMNFECPLHLAEEVEKEVEKTLCSISWNILKWFHPEHRLNLIDDIYNTGL